MIEEGAFNKCTCLRKIDVAAGNKAYSGRDGILYNKSMTVLNIYPEDKPDSSFVIPDNVNIIASRAFEDCNHLKNITIRNSVYSIGYLAFSNCKKLESITISDSVFAINGRIFSGCTSLSKIEVGAGNKAYSGKDGILYNKAMNTLICYPEGKPESSFILPDSVTNIFNEAFSDCSSLTSITIPASVTNIGDFAFNKCINLSEAKFLGDAPTMGTNVFFGCDANFRVYYFKGRTGYTNPWHGYTTVMLKS
jgi:hypothetical protein